MALGRTLIVCVALLAAVAHATPVRELNYNAHSFDDLDLHIQLLWKGVKCMKLDIQPMDYASCSTYSTWSGEESSCVPYKGGNACCLGLRGDTSGAPTVDQPFNTTDELVALISDPAHAQFYSDPANPVSLQLDFIITPSAYPPVVPMYNTFLAQLAKLQQTLHLLTPDYNDDVNYATNIDMSGMEDQCTSGWPNLPNYYVWWEPSTQQELITTIDQFTSCANVPASKRYLNNNTRVTCNQGPEMFEVFSSSVIGRGNNTLVQSNATLPVATVLHGRSADDAVLALAYTVGTSQSLELRCVASNSKITSIPSTIGAITSLSASASGPSTSTLLASSASGAYFTVEVTMGAGCAATVGPASSGKLAGLGGSWLSTAVANASDAAMVAGLQMPASSGDSCKLYLCTAPLPSAGKATCSCLQSHATVKDGSVAVDSTSGSGVVTYETTVAGLPTVQAATFTLSSSGATVKAVSAAGSRLDFGSQPSVQVLSVMDEAGKASTVVLEVHTNGMCQGGEALNNNELNKCNIATAVNSEPPLRSVSGLLNYNYGSFAAWQAKIEAGGFMSGCDECILHGKFDVGVNPSVHALPTLVEARQGGNLMRVVEVHNADTAMSPFLGFCGLPVKKSGIVMDVFHVTKPSSLPSYKRCQ